MNFKEAADLMQVFSKQFKALETLQKALSEIGDLELAIKELEAQREKAMANTREEMTKYAQIKREIENVTELLMRRKKAAETVEADAARRAQEMLANAAEKAREMVDAASEHVKVSMKKHGQVVRQYDEEIVQKKQELQELTVSVDKMKEVFSSLKERLNV